jgi:hypothetical protein
MRLTKDEVYEKIGQWMEDAGECYVDRKQHLFNASTLMVWMFGKGYIDQDVFCAFAEHNNSSENKYCITLQEFFEDDNKFSWMYHIFKNNGYKYHENMTSEESGRMDDIIEEYYIKSLMYLAEFIASNEYYTDKFLANLD